MAAMTSSTAVSFTGLSATVSCSAKAKVGGPVKASFKDLGLVAAATAASAMLVGNAVAGDQKMKFKNNAWMPHNVVFVEEEAAGVEVAKISVPGEDGGGTYSMRLVESFDCATPRQGAEKEEDARQIHRKLVARLMKPW